MSSFDWGETAFDSASVGLLRLGGNSLRFCFCWPSSIGRWLHQGYGLQLGIGSSWSWRSIGLVNSWACLLVLPCCLLRLRLEATCHGLRFWMDLVQMCLLILPFYLGSQHGIPRLRFMFPSPCLFRFGH